MNYKSYKLDNFDLVKLLKDENIYVDSIYQKFIKHNAYIGGGFARVIALKYFNLLDTNILLQTLAGYHFTDIDIYFPKLSDELIKFFQNDPDFISHASKYLVNNEAMRLCLYKQIGFTQLNLILFTSGDICDILEGFDISTSQCAVDLVNNKLIVREDFFELETEEKIILNPKFWSSKELSSEKIVTSLARIVKYLYRINGHKPIVIIENFVNTLMTVYNNDSNLSAVKHHVDAICKFLPYEDKIQLQMFFNPEIFAEKIINNSLKHKFKRPTFKV